MCRKMEALATTQYLDCMKTSAFTLVELLTAMAVASIIVIAATVAIRNSIIDSTVKSKQAAAAVINQGRARALNDDSDNPVLFGNDVDAIEAFLVARGYIQPIR